MPIKIAMIKGSWQLSPILGHTEIIMVGSISIYIYIHKSHVYSYKITLVDDRFWAISILSEDEPSDNVMQSLFLIL